MRAWRYLAAVVLALTAAPVTWAQSCNLVEAVQAGDTFHYTIDMKLNGEMRFRKDSGTVPVKMTASASHAFPERVLVVNGNVVKKSARIYEKAHLGIERSGDRSSSDLRASRKLIIAQREKDQHLAYCPAGAMYRSELDLVSGHFDTLHLSGVLPGKVVKTGETWKLANLVAQALCGLEGLTENKLEAKLDKVQGDVATLTITGTANGVEAGALVKQTIDAAASYDARAKRLTRVVWKQTSERDMGPVSPASTLEVVITLDRKVIARPSELSDVALVSVPEGFTPPGSMTNLEYRDPKDRYGLIHPRDWVLTAVTSDHTVLRLMDRGDYIAQVTVTPWTRASKGEHLSPDQFKAAMRSTSGWRPEQELQASELPAEGKYVYRLSEQGQLDGVPVLQNFYLVAAPSGEQVVLTFTLAPKLADKLGAKDLSIATSIEVPASSEKK